MLDKQYIRHVFILLVREAGKIRQNKHRQRISQMAEPAARLPADVERKARAPAEKRQRNHVGRALSCGWLRKCQRETALPGGIQKYRP